MPGGICSVFILFCSRKQRWGEFVTTGVGSVDCSVVWAGMRWEVPEHGELGVLHGSGLGMAVGAGSGARRAGDGL